MCASWHRREKVSLIVGAKIYRFMDYVMKFKNFSYLEYKIIVKKFGGHGPHGEPAYASWP